MVESAVPELTKAEQKTKGDELAPADLKAFGILPPDPGEATPVKSDKPEATES